ncbi:MAG: PQQ-binding-like beta-propeller repeat protein, partial [Planctomycetales bacterium]|nr:PQQ-binding-like beta-propeller repeat protein [Planctomycetales bacterium]
MTRFHWLSIVLAVTVCSLSCSAPADTTGAVGSSEPQTPASASQLSATPGESEQGGPLVSPASSGTQDVAAAANDWSRFRGPEGNGASSATGLPTSWSESENIVWKTPLPGAGASSPVVQNGHIYLTAFSGYLVPGEPRGTREQLKRHLLCVALADGEVVWQMTEPAKLPEEESIRDHGFAANSPAADADHVYAFYGKSGVVAYS